MEQSAFNTVVPIARERKEPDLSQARQAQRQWNALPIDARLAVIRQFRDRLAAESGAIARSIDQRPAVESLSGEILPLLESCRYLEGQAARVLRLERRRRRSAAWLRGITVDVAHEPYGIVLIIGPANYGLMLPGIQTLQALVAGNAVVIKPAPGSREILDRFAAILATSGLPAGLLTVTDESIETANQLIGAGVDRVIFTGSGSVGRSVLQRASESLVPAIVELSGWDACVVLESADLQRTARAIAFAMRFNNGQTCLAPRRILVQPRQRDALVANLIAELRAGGRAEFSPTDFSAVIELAEDALRRGARLAYGEIWAESVTGPLLLTDITKAMPIFATEVFGPIALITEVADTADAVLQANGTPYALGATVFGSKAEALDVAAQLNAGVVMINDAVVPAAHPELPIAARGSSGFGATRGPEGLLAFTRPKSIVINASRRPMHLEPANDRDEAMLGAYIQAAYRINWFDRARGAFAAISAVRGRRREEKN